MDIEDTPERYLQSPACLEPAQDSNQLWRLPIQPLNTGKTNVGPMADAPINIQSYTKRCSMIERNWFAKTSADYIPTELHATTPYSLALLGKLATLSSRTKTMREQCHVELLVLIKRREQLINTASTPWIVTQTGRANVEAEIHERIDGVTLADVDHLITFIGNHQSHKKLARAERHHTEVQDQQAKAVQRVIERREAKQGNQIQLQRELWEDRKDGGVELVDIEWHEDEQMSGAADFPKSKKQLKKERKRQQAKEMLLAKEAARKDAIQSIANRTSNGVSKAQARKTVRATTITQLASKLQEEEENAWTESDSDSDRDIIAKHNAILDPGILEPRSALLTKKKKKIVNGVNGLVGTMDVQQRAETPVESSEARKERKRQHRNNPEEQKRREQWLKGVLEKSVRLPSERMDFSTLPKLESGAQRQTISDMMGVLNSMDVQDKK